VTDDRVDLYAVGVLRELQTLGRVLNPGWMRAHPWPRWLPRHPSADTLRGSAPRWRRHTVRRLPATLRRAALRPHGWAGWYAEPRTFPPGVTRLGTGWTRRRALADLTRRIEKARAPLSVVPSGYAQGRADAQLTHTPTGHYGDGDGHSCRCDSWRLAPHLRGRPHACLCTDGPEEPSHLPPGGPPWITASTAGNPL
jgi:hypothetical protein